jgi:hypothetical protein
MPYTFRARFCPICGCGGYFGPWTIFAEHGDYFCCDNPEQAHYCYPPTIWEDYRVINILSAENVHQTIRENPLRPNAFRYKINRLRKQFGLAIWRELPSVEEWLHQSPFE